MDINQYSQRSQDNMTMMARYAVNTPRFPHPTIPHVGNISKGTSSQCLMPATSESSDFLANFNLPSPPMPSQPQTPWEQEQHCDMSLNFHSHFNNSEYPINMASVQQGENVFDSVPRSLWQAPYNPQIVEDGPSPLETFHQPYNLDFQRQAYHSPPNYPSDLQYNAQDNASEFARMSIRHSPRLEDDIPKHMDAATMYRQTSNTLTEDLDSPPHELTYFDLEDRVVDEPYAKLIYRALMSDPQHSMVLQDIYKWFRQNTSKGDSESRGWMNSIRHNLSMNAAFRKTERRTPGEEGKKCTEWVLEDFAIRDGVQSTTRYRKGTGLRRSLRADNPTSSRQSAGRKGGHSASVNKYRLRQRMRQPVQLLDSDRYSHIPQRRHSPLTPPAMVDLTNGLYYPKSEPYESALGYRFEDTQGIMFDDHPLFSNHGLPLNMCADEQY